MIGVVGAVGGVGAHVTRLLANHGDHRLRLGGRRLDAVRRLAGTVVGDAEVMRVDADDDASMRTFALGCRVVVDCAGPSAHLAERAARAAWAAGADHVDAGGDAAAAAALARDAPSAATAGPRRAVLAAGAWPGLSGLLPRWLAARGFTAVETLRSHVGVRDRFTPGAAADYLTGALGEDSEPLAAWRGGARRSHALTRLTVDLPGFGAAVSAFPALDDEGEVLARELGLRHGDWFAVLPDAWSAVLDRARTRPHAEAVADLCRAAELDVAGRTASTTFLVQLDGTGAGGARTRTAVLQGPGVSELTGAVAAAAALAVAAGEVPPGAHCAAAVLHPVTTLARLREMGGCEPVVTEGPLEDLLVIEEGAL